MIYIIGNSRDREKVRGIDDFELRQLELTQFDRNTKVCIPSMATKLTKLLVL